jgi:hypothetical protein
MIVTTHEPCWTRTSDPLLKADALPTELMARCTRPIDFKQLPYARQFEIRSWTSKLYQNCIKTHRESPDLSQNTFLD